MHPVAFSVINKDQLDGLGFMADVDPTILLIFQRFSHIAKNNE